MEEYIYKILHKSTGLFYCSRKGRWEEDRTNLSTKGNFYDNEKTVNKVFAEDCHRADINKAQVERFGLKRMHGASYTRQYSSALVEDFTIVKYRLTKVEE